MNTTHEELLDLLYALGPYKISRPSNLADALLPFILRAKVETWDEGYRAGRDDEAFESRGLSTDKDAHEYPHANPHHRAGRTE